MLKGYERLSGILVSEYNKTKVKFPADITLLEKHGLAHLFETFYSSLEDEIKKVFMSKGKPIPDSEQWHKELLSAAKEISLLSDTTFELMEELLKFRHWSRYAFLEEIQWERLSENLDRVEICSQNFRSDVEKFLKS